MGREGAREREREIEKERRGDKQKGEGGVKQGRGRAGVCDTRFMHVCVGIELEEGKREGLWGSARDKTTENFFFARKREIRKPVTDANNFVSSNRGRTSLHS